MLFIPKKEHSFGEIIRSDLSSWDIHAWQHEKFVPFGSLVVSYSGDKIIFGIISNIRTICFENRLAYPFEQTSSELLSNHPEIFPFIKTELTAISVGYQEHEKIYYQLPQKPPLLHTFIAEAPDELLTHFFSSEDYLYTIGKNLIIGELLDEFLLAVLSIRMAKGLLNAKQLQYFVTLFSVLTNNNYARIKLFLQRLHTRNSSMMQYTDMK